MRNNKAINRQQRQLTDGKDSRDSYYLLYFGISENEFFERLKQLQGLQSKNDNADELDKMHDLPF